MEPINQIVGIALLCLSVAAPLLTCRTVRHDGIIGVLLLICAVFFAVIVAVIGIAKVGGVQ